MPTNAGSNRANGKIYTTVNRSTRTIEFDWRRTGYSVLTFHMDRVAAEQHENAEVHGWVQRLRDAAAGQTIDKGRARIQSLITHYESSSKEWDVRPQRGPSNADMLTAALVALKNKPEAVIRAYVDSKSAAAQRKLMAQQDIADKIAELFGDSGDDFDLDSELDQFEAETQPGGDTDADDEQEVNADADAE